jgi:hypothetical protein
MFATRILIAALLFSPTAFPCSIEGGISNVHLVEAADAIVRATAVEYANPPANTGFLTTGVPDSTIRFRILETLRGKVPAELVLPGYLADRDDFNDQPAPYSFVRPGGRAGSCFANSYRAGAQFLLFLKKLPDGELTVNWYALGPVNEQLHPLAGLAGEDPWLLWVREQVRKNKETTPPSPAAHPPHVPK